MTGHQDAEHWDYTSNSTGRWTYATTRKVRISEAWTK